jgi:hypothetical protein
VGEMEHTGGSIESQLCSYEQLRYRSYRYRMKSPGGALRCQLQQEPNRQEQNVSPIPAGQAPVRANAESPQGPVPESGSGPTHVAGFTNRTPHAAKM